MLQSQTSGPRQLLTLFDSICITVGIIVGVGIYETAPTVAAGAGSAWGTILFWLMGGVLSLAGSLCIAELATTYPEEGGEYVYLSRAFSRTVGYLFAWSACIIIRPGSIAAMAFPFAHYAIQVWPNVLPQYSGNQDIVVAAAVVIALTAINIAGVRSGARVQNLLTVVKVLGAGAVVAACFAVEETQPLGFLLEIPSIGSFNLALILVLFTYGGWNEIAYIAAEVKHPERNIIRALVLSTLLVTIIYAAMNYAFFRILGFASTSRSEAVAALAMSTAFPHITGAAISGLICLSALGAVNGMILTGARISFAAGQNHRVFAPLGTWSARFKTPAVALVVQGLLSMLIIIAAGSFNRTVVYTSTVVWIFFSLTAVAFFVLRWKDAHVHRPYAAHWHPIPGLIFCMFSFYLLYSAITYDVQGSLISIVLMLCGIPIKLLCEKSKKTVLMRAPDSHSEP